MRVMVLCMIACAGGARGDVGRRVARLSAARLRFGDRGMTDARAHVGRRAVVLGWEVDAGRTLGEAAPRQRGGELANGKGGAHAHVSRSGAGGG